MIKLTDEERRARARVTRIAILRAVAFWNERSKALYAHLLEA